MATPRPRLPPIVASTLPSISSCRTTRRRLAPSELRIAISRARRVVRLNIRFATFADEMRTIRPPAVMNASQTVSFHRPK